MRKTSRVRSRKTTDAAKMKFATTLDRIADAFATRSREQQQQPAPTRSKPPRSKPTPSKATSRDTRTLKEATQAFQRGFVFEALQQHAVRTRWNIQATARRLEISRSHLYLLIEELGLEQMRADRLRAERSMGRRG